MRITEFSTEGFPLVIAARKPALQFNALASDANYPESGALAAAIGARHLRIVPSANGETRKQRLTSQSNPALGSSCLSVIGMIEPGKTIRLYRQIN